MDIVSVRFRIFPDVSIDIFCDWLARQQSDGIRLVVMEGYMGAGKSTLARDATKRFPTMSFVELDGLLEPGLEDGDRTWTQAVGEAGGEAVIRSALGSAQLVVAEGVMAWEVAKPLFSEMPGHVRRVLVEKFRQLLDTATCLPVPELAFTEPDEGPLFFSNIRAYHRDDATRDSADLIIECVLPDPT